MKKIESEAKILARKQNGIKYQNKTNLKILKLKGTKFGKWKIKNGIIERKCNGKLKYLWCICECGKEKQVSYQDLVSGKNKQCHTCANRDNNIGKQFNYLTVLEVVGHTLGDKIIFKCRCRCGNIKRIIATNILHGKTQSCGCLKKELARQKKKTEKIRYLKCINCYKKFTTNSIEKIYCNVSCANKYTAKLRRRKVWLLNIIEQRIAYLS